jgi:putative oxidoreductase
MSSKICPETVAPVRRDMRNEDTQINFARREGGVALRQSVKAWEATIHRWLMRHSITALSISMGIVILGFGILKYFPGVSPAQDLVLGTTRALTFGLVPAMVPESVVMILLATVECAIGVSLIIGRALRVTIYLLAPWVLGILSPLVLLPARLFSGPNHVPTLEGQYVIKDLILLAAAMVIATTVRRRHQQ